jgi:hypothetical protein
MKMRSLTATILGLATISLLSRQAEAEGPYHFEQVRAADVPVVQVEPNVAWKTWKWGEAGEPDPLPKAELARPEFDWSAMARPRWTNEQGNAAVVRVRNLYNPDDSQSNQWLRYLQADDAPPITNICGPYAGETRGVDTYLLEATRPEGPRYTYMEAWFDGTTCKGKLLRSYQAKVVPFANGLVYAYRTHCESCAGVERDKLHLLLPTAQSSRGIGEGVRFRYWTYLMEHMELPLGMGTSGTVTARIDERSIQSWNRVLPSPLPVADVELHVETSFASNEAEPTLVVATRAVNVLAW